MDVPVKKYCPALSYGRLNANSRNSQRTAVGIRLSLGTPYFTLGTNSLCREPPLIEATLMNRSFREVNSLWRQSASVSPQMD